MEKSLMQLTQTSEQLIELVSLGQDQQAIEIFSRLNQEEKKAVMLAAPIHHKITVLTLETSAEGVRSLIKDLHSIEVGAVVVPEVGTAMGSAIGAHLDLSAVLKVIKTLIGKGRINEEGVLELLMLVRENEDPEQDTYASVLRNLPDEIWAYLHRVYYNPEEDYFGAAEQLFNDLESQWYKKFKRVKLIARTATESELSREVQKVLEEII